jgi:hypothetical protein
VHPDGGEARRPDVEGDAVGDLVLVREVDPQLPIERHAQVLGQGGVGLLGYRGGLHLDARQVGRVHDLEVRRLGHPPVDFRVVARIEVREALGRGGRRHERRNGQNEGAGGREGPAEGGGAGGRQDHELKSPEPVTHR